MDNQRAEFSDFWPHYLDAHRDPRNRVLHVTGTASAIVVLITAIVMQMPLLLLLVPLVGYGPAWLGHFFIEHNRPVAFKRPMWALRADLKMTWLVLAGQFQNELSRVDKANS